MEIYNINLVDTSGILHRCNYFADKYDSGEDQIELQLQFVNESRYLLQNNASNATFWLNDCPDRDYWKRDYYPDYKGHRTSGSSLRDTSAIFNRVAKKYNFTVLQLARFEADDLAGAVIRFLEQQKSDQVFKINLLTGDSDWQGLITKRVSGIYPMSPYVRDVDVAYDWLENKWNKQGKAKKAAWILPSRKDFVPSDIWIWKSIVGDRGDNLAAGSDLGVISLRNPLVDCLEAIAPKIKEKLRRFRPFACSLTATQKYVSDLVEIPVPIVRL